MSGKPLIEVSIVSTDGESVTKTTFDFDMVMGVSPFTHKLRGTDGKFQQVMGSMLMLRNNREIFVTQTYDELTEQWIKLTHPCVNVPDGSDAPHHVCDHGFAARTCGLCNHGSTFGSGR